MDQEPKAGIKHLRKEYEKAVLHKSDLPQHPMDALAEWFEFAVASAEPEPNAMALATCGSDLRPSNRIVLAKDIQKKGVVFFTNYLSKKGRQMEENPWVSATFFWQSLERQVRIEGKATKVTKEESDAYFSSRPLLSRAGAIASMQSKVVASREELDAAMQRIIREGEKKGLERPEHWGGYLIEPFSVEFWQGRPGRVHDRILYTKEKDETWVKVRLSP